MASRLVFVNPWAQPRTKSPHSTVAPVPRRFCAVCWRGCKGVWEGKTQHSSEGRICEDNFLHKHFLASKKPTSDTQVLWKFFWSHWWLYIFVLSKTTRVHQIHYSSKRPASPKSFHEFEGGVWKWNGWYIDLTPLIGIVIANSDNPPNPFSKQAV